MKKLICPFAAIVLVCAGCAAPATTTAASAPVATSAPAATTAAQTALASAAATDSPLATVAVDKSGDTIKVTIPATLVNGNADDTINNAKAQGVGDVVKNADGSLTYTMSKEVYQTMLDAMKTSIQTSIAGMKTAGTYASVKEITGNSDFTEFTVTVDQEKFSASMDSFALLSIYLGASYYEVFNGQAEPKVTFHLVDAATKTEFQTLVYPDDMKTGA